MLPINIHKIIAESSIYIEYQPIMSTHHKDFLGFEALSRSREENQVISPIDLFEAAQKEGLTWELDLICIRKAMDGFTEFFLHDPTLILFLNIDASIIHQYLDNSILLDFATKYRISPSNIVLEINELQNDSIKIMQEFTLSHRAQGFLIAVDDIGAGSSNLDRIPMIKPNVMKIDKELVKNIHTSFYKEQVVNTIMQLATNIGASVVIEGIESIEDLIKVSAQGAQLIQGYFLSKPLVMTFSDINRLKSKIKSILEQLYDETKKQMQLSLTINLEMQLICNQFVRLLETISINLYEDVMEEFLLSKSCVESVYILNDEGYLITDTILNKSVESKKINALYSPCKKGDSVELESYYTQLIYGGNDFWISSEYLSMATGNKNCTLSRSFQNIDDETVIICIDFYKNLIQPKNKKNEVYYYEQAKTLY